MKIEIEIPLEKDDIGHLLRIPDEIISLLKWQEGDMLEIPFQTFTNKNIQLTNPSENPNGNLSTSGSFKKHVRDHIPEKTVQSNRTMRSFTETMFVGSLQHKEKKVLNTLIEQIKREFNDSRIEPQEHRQHYAIKYNKGRAKAWMVIKLSGGKLLFWIRINPENFNDPKNLSKPYRDAIPHGNRQIILNEENFEDIMDLIRQSYEFRTQDNFNELYKKAVSDEFGKIN